MQGPIPQRFHELLGDPGSPDMMLAAGANKAQLIAEATLSQVAKLLGLA